MRQPTIHQNEGKKSSKKSQGCRNVTIPVNDDLHSKFNETDIVGQNGWIVVRMQKISLRGQ
jgi:hypothetical protein